MAKILVCECCGKEFTSKNGYTAQKYCSKDCYNKCRATKKVIKKLCASCGKEFVTKRQEQIFCCVQCRVDSTKVRVECICDFCGKRFSRKKSEVTTRKRHFCSEECKYDAIAWSDHDLNILREYYGVISSGQICDMLEVRREPRRVRKKAQEIGLKVRDFWTDEEVSILVNNYSVIPLSDLTNMLPGRTVPSIHGKAVSLGLFSYGYISKYYNDSDIKYLSDNYLEKSDEEMAAELGRSPGAVSQKLRLLGFVRPYEIKKDGYLKLSKYVRSRTYFWRDDVISSAGYVCVS